MIQPSEVIYIGKVRKSNNAKGELLCLLENDLFPEAEPEFVVLLCDNILVPFFVEDYRFRGEDGLLLRLEGITDERQSQRLCGAKLYILRSSLSQDLIESMPQHTLEGFLLIDEHKGELGHIEAIDDSTLNILWKLNNGTLIPAHKDLVRTIDTAKKIVYVSLPEGLI